MLKTTPKPFRLFSVSLGWLSLVGMILSNVYVFFVNWSFIFSGEGVGAYSVVVHAFAFLITFAAWAFSFAVYRNRLLAILYWAACLLPRPIFLIFPVWFQASTL